MYSYNTIRKSAVFVSIIPAVIAFFVMTQISIAADYPKIANLWGVRDWTKEFSASDYDNWARYDMLVTAGGSFEQRRRFHKQIKSRNPKALILYTVGLTNLSGVSPWMKDEWYLRRANGEVFKYWSGTIKLPNLFIEDCFNAVVKHAEKAFGNLYKAGFIDGIFVDSVIGRVSYWADDIDTNLDGAADVPSKVDPLWHQRQNLFFDKLRKRNPGLLIVANSVDAGHAPHVHGRLLEGVNTFDFVANGVRSPHDVIYALERWGNITLKPALTFALMCYAPMAEHKWREGKSENSLTPGDIDAMGRNFTDMRLGLITTLMTDSYYSYDFGSFVYGYPAFWYAEYDAPLGAPLGSYKEIPLGDKIKPETILQWQAGDNAEIFKLEQGAGATKEGIKAGFTASGSKNYNWQKLFATYPAKVSLKAKGTYRIKAECLTLGKDMPFLKFVVRTDNGGTISIPPSWQDGKLHDKGLQLFVMQGASAYEGEGNRRWHIDTVVTIDDFDDYALEWSLRYSEGGNMVLKSLKIERINETYFMREFEGGVVILNSTSNEVTVPLKKPMRKIDDNSAPLYVLTIDDWQESFSINGEWQTQGGEEHYYGVSYRFASAPDLTACWSFKSPSTDKYAVYAAIPTSGAKLTNTATYTMKGLTNVPVAAIDQCKGDGGWIKLFEVELIKGQNYKVTVLSGKEGITAADAIRIESSARFNNGSVVDKVTLCPLDGVILLNKID